MPRAKTIRTDHSPYHIVARTHNKQSFSLPMPEMWEIYAREIKFVCEMESARIIAFVMMKNHFHLMLWTPQSNIDKIMYWIMKKSTLAVQKKTGIINSIYGGRYKPSLLIDRSYQLNAFKYILRNPVAAGIVKEVENYCYSSYHYQFYNKKLLFSLEDFFDDEQFATSETIKHWLNYSFKERESMSIKTGLERPTFRYAKERCARRFITPQLPLDAPLDDLEPGTRWQAG